MKITDITVLNNTSISSIEIVDSLIKISLKNGTTLILTPEIEDEKINYKLDYLTGKENKQIEKIQNKIQELKLEVERIKESTSSEDEDNETDNETKENDEE